LNRTLDVHPSRIERDKNGFDLETLTNLLTLSLVFWKPNLTARLRRNQQVAGPAPELQVLICNLSTRRQAGFLNAIDLHFQGYDYDTITSDEFILSPERLVLWGQLDSLLIVHPFTQTSITLILRG